MLNKINKRKSIPKHNAGKVRQKLDTWKCSSKRKNKTKPNQGNLNNNSKEKARLPTKVIRQITDFLTVTMDAKK